MSPESSGEVLITARDEKGKILKNPQDGMGENGRPLALVGARVPLSLPILADELDLRTRLATLHYDTGTKENFVARVVNTRELEAELFTLSSTNLAAVQALAILRNPRFKGVRQWAVPGNGTYQITPLDNEEVDPTHRKEIVPQAIKETQEGQAIYKAMGDLAPLQVLQSNPQRRQAVNVHTARVGEYSAERGQSAQAWLRGEAVNGFTLVDASADLDTYDAKSTDRYDLSELHLRTTIVASTFGESRSADRQPVRMTLTPRENGYQVTRFSYEIGV